MKTLVIHPDDRSTDFLRYIYANMEVTLINKDTNRNTILEHIMKHDQVIACGHGSPGGLFNVSNVGDGTYALGANDVFYLRNKRLIAIWCNADQFIMAHRLNALYSGMFISEVGEANMFKVDTTQEQVDESNNLFAQALGYFLKTCNYKYGDVYKNLVTEYSKLAQVNSVAAYNNERLYLTEGFPMVC